jgi:hypothetical protein
MVAKPGSEANAQGVPAWKERTDAMLAMQREFVDTCEHASQVWLSRVKSEAELWSELATRLTGTHSVPEALSACQQTIAQRMQMASEDGKRLSDEAQKFMKVITTTMSNGSPTARS